MSGVSSEGLGERLACGFGGVGSSVLNRRTEGRTYRRTERRTYRRRKVPGCSATSVPRPPRSCGACLAVKSGWASVGAGGGSGLRLVAGLALPL
jgi:hypothetical protein